MVSAGNKTLNPCCIYFRILKITYFGGIQIKYIISSEISHGSRSPVELKTCVEIENNLAGLEPGASLKFEQHGGRIKFLRYEQNEETNMGGEMAWRTDSVPHIGEKTNC